MDFHTGCDKVLKQGVQKLPPADGRVHMTKMIVTGRSQQKERIIERKMWWRMRWMAQGQALFHHVGPLFCCEIAI
jgi:hypothetical protein